MLIHFKEKPEYKKFVSNDAPIVFTQCRKAKGGGYLCLPDFVGYMPIPLYGVALFAWLKNKQKEKASPEEDTNSLKQ